MANNISVSISADVSDLVAKRAILSAQLAAASKDLRGFAEAARASGGTGQLSAGMLAAAESVAQTKAQIAAATAEIKGLGAQSVTTGAEVSASLKEMRDTGAEVRANFRGIGEALVAAFAVHEIADLAKNMADTAEQTQHVADTFGLTTDEVQRLRAEAAGLGVPFDAATTALQREDGALTRAREGSKQTAVAFKALGIDIKAPVDNATLLQETIAGLANVADVPARVGLAMQLFGRNIQNIAPLINVTKGELDQVNAAIERSGAVSASAQSAGLGLARAFDMQKIEMQGVGNTLTSELAPSLTKLVNDITGMMESFRQWASQGSNLKDTLTGLTVAAVALASVLGAGALTAAVEGLAGLLGGIFLGALEVATGGMVAFDAAADANPIGAIVLAVEALVAGLVLLYQWLAKVVDFNVVWEKLSDLIDLVGDVVHTVTDAFRPLTDAVNSFIAAQTRIEASGVIAWFQQLGAQLKTGWDTLVGATTAVVAWMGQVDQAVDKVLGLSAGLADLNKSIGDAMTSAGDFLKANFPGVVSGWDSWVKTLKGDVDQLTDAWNRFTGAARATGPSGQIGDKVSPVDINDLRAKVQDLMASGKPGGNPPDLSTSRGGGGKDRMEAYRTALAQMEDQIRASTGAWLADLSQTDLDYWQAVLDHAKLTAAQRIEVEHSVAELTKKLGGEVQADKLAQDRAQIEADKGNVAALTADWKQYVADTVTAYAAGSRAVIKATAEMTAAILGATKEEAAARIKSIQDMNAETERGVQSQVQDEKTAGAEAIEALKQRYESGQINARDYYAQLAALRRQDARDEVAAIQAGLIVRLAALNMELEDATLSATQKADILKQEVAANDAAAKAIAAILTNLYKQIGTDLNQQLQQFKQRWDQTIGQLTQTFAQGLLKMAQGGELFSQLMRGIGQKILVDWVNNIAKMVSDWLRGAVANLAATTTTNAAIVTNTQATANANLLITLETNLKKVMSDARTAAAGAYNWAAAWGGPIAGAISAAAAFAGVMAFGAAASAEGGYDVPAGVNPLTQLHAQEMVLPASIAQPLKTSLASGAGPWGGGGGGGDIHFGDFHVHGAPAGMSSSEFRQALSDHASHVASAVGAAVRGGWRAPRGLAGKAGL